MQVLLTNVHSTLALYKSTGNKETTTSRLAPFFPADFCSCVHMYTQLLFQMHLSAGEVFALT